METCPSEGASCVTHSVRRAAVSSKQAGPTTGTRTVFCGCMARPVAFSIETSGAAKRPTTETVAQAAATSSAQARRMRTGASNATAKSHPLPGQPCATPLSWLNSGTKPTSVAYKAWEPQYNEDATFETSAGGPVATMDACNH